ncbi:MAG: hypothetical protein ACRDQA_29805 [Nocardioidaceae bacterium]
MRDRLHDLMFSFGEGGEAFAGGFGLARFPVGDGVDESFGDRRGEHRVAGGDGVDRGGEVLG